MSLGFSSSKIRAWNIKTKLIIVSLRDSDHHQIRSSRIQVWWAEHMNKERGSYLDRVFESPLWIRRCLSYVRIAWLVWTHQQKAMPLNLHHVSFSWRLASCWSSSSTRRRASSPRPTPTTSSSPGSPTQRTRWVRTVTRYRYPRLQWQPWNNRK